MNARLDDAPRPAPPLHPMTLADLDGVLDLEVRAYAHPWSRGNFIDSLAAGYTARVARDADDGRLLGYFVAQPGVDELHLLNLTVSPEHQGRGLGRALLEAVVGLTRAQPAARLLLEVREGNLRARRLYAGRGFVEVGRRRGYYPARGGREDAVVMSLTLAPAGGGAGDL